MRLNARIRRFSATWRLWEGHRRTGGLVRGVAFRWTPGADFVAEDLSADQVQALKGVVDVEIEAFGASMALKQLPVHPSPFVSPRASSVVSDPPAVALSPSPAEVVFAPPPDISGLRPEPLAIAERPAPRSAPRQLGRPLKKQQGQA